VLFRSYETGISTHKLQGFVETGPSSGRTKIKLKNVAHKITNGALSRQIRSLKSGNNEMQIRENLHTEF
jgi:hypothetical protein